MDKPDIKPIMTLSGSDFSRRIITKYKTGKMSILRLTMMIFCKKCGCFLHKMSISFKMYFNNQNIVPPLNIKFNPSTKGMLSWSNTGNNTLHLAVGPKEVQKVINVKMATNRQILKYKNNVKILNFQTCRARINFPNYRSLNTVENSSSVNKEATHKNQYKSPAILLQNSVFFYNAISGLNKLIFKNLTGKTFNKPSMKNYYGNFRPAPSSSAQIAYAYKTDSEIMRFQDSGHLEQEIEQIKKLVIQTKESIPGKPTFAPGEADIKRYLDINRISDKVYQNIERTIRMERERRGM